MKNVCYKRLLTHCLIMVAAVVLLPVLTNDLLNHFLTCLKASLAVSDRTFLVSELTIQVDPLSSLVLN